MNKITPHQIQLAMTAGGSATSAGIDLGAFSNEQRFSLQAVIVGDGTMDLIVLCSNDGINYRESSSPVILENYTATTPNADGISAPISFTVPLCKWIKFQATETGEVNTLTATIYVCVQ